MITDRIDGITLIRPEQRRKDPPAPKSVKIELTGRCNYRCGFCALRTRKVQPKGDMTLEFFKKSRGMEEGAELTDEFAKGMGFPTLEEFKTARADVDRAAFESALARAAWVTGVAAALGVPVVLTEEDAATNGPTDARIAAAVPDGSPVLVDKGGPELIVLSIQHHHSMGCLQLKD